jgi:hypothetical protein
MQPSLGRIVVYHHPGSADGKYPPSKSPALVHSVNDDGSLRLWVFGPWGIFLQPSITQGDGPSQWNWPPRV